MARHLEAISRLSRRREIHHLVAPIAVRRAVDHLRKRRRWFDRFLPFSASEAEVESVPGLDEEWRTLRAQLHAKGARPAGKRSLAPVLWFGAPLAAAAALALTYLGWQQKPIEQFSPDDNIAEAEFVEAGDASTSLMVYVDKDSGWLVVWATDNDAATKG